MYQQTKDLIVNEQQIKDKTRELIMEMTSTGDFGLLEDIKILDNMLLKIILNK